MMMMAIIGCLMVRRVLGVGWLVQTMLFQVIPFNSPPLSQVKQDADADADDADDADADANLLSCDLCAKKCKGETQMTIMMQASIDCIVAGDLCVKNCGADVKQMTNMP